MDTETIVGRPRRRLTRALTTGPIIVVLVAGLTACGKDSPSATPGPTTKAPATTIDPLRDPDGAFGGNHGSVPSNWCDSKPPGQPVPAAEAVVKFSSELVCPGYVTVTQGTPVTWQNLDSVPHVVTITPTISSDEVLDQQTVAPGATWVRPFPVAGTFGYRTDAIPSYRGTVEVQGPGGSTHGA